MPSEKYSYKFSVTIRTDDKALVYCLRALSKFSQQSGNNNIPWGGTKDAQWKKDDNHVTFRFSSPEYRTIFEEEIKRLMPCARWTVVSRSDNNPPS